MVAAGTGREKGEAGEIGGETEQTHERKDEILNAKTICLCVCLSECECVCVHVCIYMSVFAKKLCLQRAEEQQTHTPA